jgi:iron complex transport system substrate-binding protein
MTMTNLNLRRFSTFALAAALLSAALILAACGDDDDTPETTGTPAATGTSATTVTSTAASPSPTAASGPRQVEAENGTIEVPADPQRVAAIGNASLPFIDLGGEPVGVTTIQASLLDLVPAEQRATFEAATNLGPSGGEVDLEKLASLKPDLILAQMPTSDFEQIQDELESIAPTVFFGLGTEWKTLADGLATAGNKAEALSELKAEFEERIATILETYREVIGDTSFVAVDRYDSSDPGVFVITHIGCVEIAKDELGLNLPARTAGSTDAQSFEQIGALSNYDAILYPVDAAGQPKKAFVPVVESNSWNALPAVNSGHALGIYCPGNNSYGAVLTYLDSLENAFKSLSTKR